MLLITWLLSFILSSVIAQAGFDWNSTEPTTNLSWVDCYSGYQCSRFRVPLNYSDPENGQSAVIAVIKLPAQGSASEYGGSIFSNPGGPGVSGVNYVLESGRRVQSIVGSQFDVISFDPRGVNFSTPRISVFHSEEEQSDWALHEPADSNSTQEALPEAWARYQAFGEFALSRDTGILNFVSTANVARDMLGMAEALGLEKLHFYGTSYGTYLGAVFASMFPDRVGNFVLDGCLDMDGALNNDLASLIVDTDKSMQTFYDSCHSAGPDSCPFYSSSPSEIEAALNDIYETVRLQPVPVSSGDTFGVLTYDRLRGAILAALEYPPLFPTLAEGLAELQAGNGTIIYHSGTATVAGLSWDALVAIWCSDTNPSDADAEQLRQYMSKINSTFAGMESLPMMNRCAGWKYHPDERFKGPFGGNTSSPLLLIGNTADPITPLSQAKKTSSVFPGSIVLTQDSPGHTTTGTNSTCTHQHIAAYFANGTLPEEGTVCSLDEPLFPDVAKR
ncbi:hypothetical protein D9758_010839 [Tetrapyrgos nigripes]|uniref:Uncharacterized protein n=1 Tax=Tetrapyrgos nigripes TaxID=182062 RepID=A0A8H5GIL2_9AGAR|nr:hypothetical protein D9758_010839 [Tetrapyrgos nigripes]